MNIYQEEILAHYHEPSNNGELKDPTHTHCGFNPTCGDKICIDLIIDHDTITDISFHGQGCAISQAAASMLTEHVKGKPANTLKNLTKDDILEILGVELSMNRMKCGLLALETAHRAYYKNIDESKS